MATWSAKINDRAILNTLKGEPEGASLEHATIWLEELEEAKEVVRPDLDASARELDRRLSALSTKWRRVEGRRGADDVHGGYDPIDLHVRWKPSWKTNGSLVLGLDLFGSPWAPKGDDRFPEDLYCTWHEQSRFVVWPTEKYNETPTEGAIKRKRSEVEENIKYWARMWSARIETLPSDLHFHIRATAVRFRGKNIRWNGSQSAEFVWPTLTYGGESEEFGYLSLDEAQKLLGTLAEGTADPGFFFFPTLADLLGAPDVDWRARVRKPVLSLVVDTRGDDVIELADRFARWIDAWPTPLRSPEAFGKASTASSRRRVQPGTWVTL